ncbi:MAG TPA: SUMF1/EgtB/PvdO family nonheme iron enzyme, partial [bacterium]|nr:SUMF1/EgtB/PvdO family nonheme iron enzyme [bacterium]
LLDRVRAKFSGAAPPASFWIDRTEVSNGDFRRYLEETGSSYRPGLWGPVEEWDPAWDALPVAGVPYREAQSYAEWAGKRLPTLAEWDLAARGPDAAMYPWGDDETLTPEALIPWANVFGDDHAWIWSPADSFPSLAPRYRERVLPVNVLPDGYRDVSWIGLVHTLGNVAEWTESVPFIQGAGDFRERIVKGDHWGRDLDETWSLRKRMTHFIESGPMLACGIRCAKTVGLEVPESAGTESPTGRR